MPAAQAWLLHSTASQKAVFPQCRASCARRIRRIIRYSSTTMPTLLHYWVDMTLISRSLAQFDLSITRSSRMPWQGHGVGFRVQGAILGPSCKPHSWCSWALMVDAVKLPHQTLSKIGLHHRTAIKGKGHPRPVIKAADPNIPAHPKPKPVSRFYDSSLSPIT